MVAGSAQSGLVCWKLLPTVFYFFIAGLISEAELIFG